jgi:hypothetical protein
MKLTVTPAAHLASVLSALLAATTLTTGLTAATLTSSRLLAAFWVSLASGLFVIIAFLILFAIWHFS